MPVHPFAGPGLGAIVAVVAQVETSDQADGIDESTVLWLIVAGLVLVAVLIAAWTVRYWIATRPVENVSDSPK